MSEQRHAFQYAVVRVVPSVERGEFLNAGVVVFCRSRPYLAARIEFDAQVVRAMAPNLDIDVVREHLAAVEHIAAGADGAGPIAALDQPQRFHWLVAPSSTVVQVSPVHTGLCAEPEQVLDRLFDRLVQR